MHKLAATHPTRRPRDAIAHYRPPGTPPCRLLLRPLRCSRLAVLARLVARAVNAAVASAPPQLHADALLQYHH